MSIHRGTDTLFQIFTNNVSEAMNELLTQCTQNNDIQSDANILKVKEHTDHVLREFETNWGIVSEILHERFPELEDVLSVDIRKRDQAHNMDKEIQKKQEIISRLKHRVHELRSQVPLLLADENTAVISSS